MTVFSRRRNETNELAACQRNLPDTIEDVAKFIVLGQEKAKALSAEIKAIKRLDLAKDVYDQKLKELDELRCLMLDAYNKMGEFTRTLPKATAGRKPGILPAGGKDFERTKSEAIQDLGLSTSQVQRMEAMSRHPEVIEQVKAEAKAGLTEPTQTEVLRRVKEAKNITNIADIKMKKCDQDVQDAVNIKNFHSIINSIALTEISDEMIDSVARADEAYENVIFDLAFSIEMLTSIRNKLTVRRCKNGNPDKQGD